MNGDVLLNVIDFVVASTLIKLTDLYVLIFIVPNKRHQLNF